MSDVLDSRRHFLSLELGPFVVEKEFFNSHSPLHSKCPKKAKQKRKVVKSVKSPGFIN